MQEIFGYIDEALQPYGASLERDVPLASFGVDSIESASLAAKVEDDWGVRLPADTLAFMTIDQMAHFIADNPKNKVRT